MRKRVEHKHTQTDAIVSTAVSETETMDKTFCEKKIYASLSIVVAVDYCSSIFLWARVVFVDTSQSMP